MPVVIQIDSEIESGLRATSAQTRTSRPKVVRQPAREHVALDKKRKSAFEIAQEMRVIGSDDDPRRDTARKHSKYVKAALRGKRSA